MSEFAELNAAANAAPSLNEMPVLDQAALPVFGEAIDSAFFDEFNLQSIVEARKVLAAERPVQVIASEKQPSGVAKIANIEKALIFSEDADDFARLEQHNIELSKSNGDVEDGSSSKSPIDGASKVASQWAVNTIIKYEEFEKLRPNLAIEYPFELDNFQKQGMVVNLVLRCINISLCRCSGYEVGATRECLRSGAYLGW